MRGFYFLLLSSMCTFLPIPKIPAPHWPSLLSCFRSIWLHSFVFSGFTFPLILILMLFSQSRFKVPPLDCIVYTKQRGYALWYNIDISINKCQCHLSHILHSSDFFTPRGTSSTTFHIGSILQGILLFIGKHPDTSSYTMKLAWIINTLSHTKYSLALQWCLLPLQTSILRITSAV